jgi:hypothetical protein
MKTEDYIAIINTRLSFFGDRDGRSAKCNLTLRISNEQSMHRLFAPAKGGGIAAFKFAQSMIAGPGDARGAFTRATRQ